MFYLFELLEEAGYQWDLLDCIHRWWGDMLDRDLKTVEEVWNALPGVDSLCHAWVAHPIYFLSRNLLGIRSLAPGWSRVQLPLCFYGDQASGAVDTPLGPVEVSWRKNRDMVGLRLTLPERMEVEVLLPNMEKRVIAGDEMREWSFSVDGK